MQEGRVSAIRTLVHHTTSMKLQMTYTNSSCVALLVSCKIQLIDVTTQLALKLPPIFIAGLSCGTIAGFQFAISHPDRVRGVFLASHLCLAEVRALFSSLSYTVSRLAQIEDVVEGRQEIFELWMEGVRTNDQELVEECISGSHQLAYNNIYTNFTTSYVIPLFTASLRLTILQIASGIHRSCHATRERRAPRTTRQASPRRLFHQPNTVYSGTTDYLRGLFCTSVPLSRRGRRGLPCLLHRRILEEPECCWSSCRNARCRRWTSLSHHHSPCPVRLSYRVVTVQLLIE